MRESTSRLDARGVVPRDVPDDVERGAVEVKEALLVEDEELDRFGGAHLRRRI